MELIVQERCKLGHQDSNPNSLSQSQLCCRYTMPDRLPAHDSNVDNALQRRADCQLSERAQKEVGVNYPVGRLFHGPFRALAALAALS